MGSMEESLPGVLEEYLLCARHRPSDFSQPSGEGVGGHQTQTLYYHVVNAPMMYAKQVTGTMRRRHLAPLRVGVVSNTEEKQDV